MSIHWLIVALGAPTWLRSAEKKASVHQTYIVDLILDKLEKKPLKVAPTIMGYFEGCHTFYKTHFPQVSLDWKRYRQFLNGIEGLRIVDLSNKFCCKRSADKIMESAEKLNLDKILCSCNGCYLSLKVRREREIDDDEHARIPFAGSGEPLRLSGCCLKSPMAKMASRCNLKHETCYFYVDVEDLNVYQEIRRFPVTENYGLWLTRIISDFLKKSPGNSLKMEPDEKAFDEVLVGFSAGADTLRDLQGCGWRSPLDAFRSLFDKVS